HGRHPAVAARPGADHHCAGRGPSCRADRAQGGRALRHLPARARSHGDRSGPDPHAAAAGQVGCRDAGARHGVLGGDDHPERAGRRVHTARRAAPPRAELPAGRRQRFAGDAVHADRADARAAQFRRVGRPLLCAVAARLRRDRLAAALP
ncbi:hypothetical protein QU38_01765, partial [Staphylococcus aureus]